MDSITIGFSAALLMGLAFGAGPCNITCLPYLGPVFLGQKNNDMRTSWQTIVPFSLGRLFGYTLLGTLAGAFGLSITQWIEQGLAGQVLGTATILIGLYLLFGSFSKEKSCTHHKQAGEPATQSVPITFSEHAISKPSISKEGAEKKKSKPYLSISLFSMGAGMALNPCIPLVSILGFAATMASPLEGAQLGIAFGLGAVIIPGLFFALAVSYFSQQVKEHLNHWSKTLERMSGVMLVLLGSFTALGWVQP